VDDRMQQEIIGGTAPMRDLYARMDRVARTDATVLLRGESGTGKELIARAIHRGGARASGPFVAINCAAIPEPLLETELFGHERGAFTGAMTAKQGRLELAGGGTVLLDEIGELPAALQAKLLRVLQEREFERVGGTRPLRVDFRLVAATNRDLERAIAAGAFREDLYYRIAVVTLRLPPLRDRRDDIPALALRFARAHAARAGRRVAAISPDALASLMRHRWPGNVRELDNAIEHAVVLGAGDQIRIEDLPESVTGGTMGAPAPASYKDAMRETRRRLVVDALQRTGHNHAAAARLLAVHPNYLHRLIRNLGVRTSRPPAPA
jgi:Nif-specific regulatory protein